MISNKFPRSKTLFLSVLMMLALTVGQVMASAPGITPTADDATTVVDRTTGIIVSVEAGGLATIQAENGQLIRVKIQTNALELKPGDHVTFAVAWINGEAVASGVKLALPADPTPMKDGDGDGDEDEDDDEEDECNCTSAKAQSIAASNNYCAKRQAAIDAQKLVSDLKDKVPILAAALLAAQDALTSAQAAGAEPLTILALQLALDAVQQAVDDNAAALAAAEIALTAALVVEAGAKATAVVKHAAWKQCCEGQTADTCPGCPESADPLACP